VNLTLHLVGVVLDSIALAIFIAPFFTLSAGHAIIGFVCTSTVFTVRVIASTSGVEIANVAVLDCRSKFKFTILSGISIAAKAFISIFFACIILANSTIHAWAGIAVVYFPRAKLAFISRVASTDVA
jgi:hypothetical protein